MVEVCESKIRGNSQLATRVPESVELRETGREKAQDTGDQRSVE